MKTVNNRLGITNDHYREDKENQPTNALCKLRKGAKESVTSKIGHQIKSKIKRMSEQGLTLRNDFQNLPQTETSLNKSVSFGNEEPLASRHTNSSRSILKNSLTRSSASLKKSQVSIANSHACSQQQSTQHSGGNKVVRDKYQQFLSDAKHSGRKFRDDIYPPVRSSIHLHNSLMGSFCQMFQKQGRTVEWLRLGEIFGSRRLTLWASDPAQKNLIGNGPLSRNWQYLPIAMNLIRQKNSILQRIFQDQHVNQNGIYRVKIYMTQQNIWKYVIIDDYIPVIVNNKLNLSNRYLPENIHPAFLTAMTPQAQSPIQIWPFLLQKAYAKYYSTYDGLANGSAYDFIEELTGTFLSTINIQQNRQKVKEILRNHDAMVMAQDNNGSYFPIRLLNTQKSTIAFIESGSSFGEFEDQMDNFLVKMKRIHYTCLHKYYHNAKCLVQQQEKGNVRWQSRQKQGLILRQFNVQEYGDCQVGVIQKQQRFFRSLLTYEYSWIRVILVQKESDGYRWLASSYSNHKTIKVSASLTPGSYVLIILPEWKNKKHDFSLLYRGTISTHFQRKSYHLYPRIMEESCMDLAQRFGKIVQINKNICSYHYIQRDAGIVIENINNEKENGKVTVLRSIEALQNIGIYPYNPEFKQEHTIQVRIPCSNHFTVVLLTKGGANQSILDMFDFGCPQN